MLRKILFFGILLTVVSWIGNGLYYVNQQLDKPIILLHYYDLPKNHNSQFNIYYIGNKMEDRDIVSVEFPQLHGKEYAITMQGSYDIDDSFTHHKLRVLDFMVDEEILKELENDLTLTEMTVHLASGETYTYPLGEVIFKEDSKGPLGFSASGSSTEGAGYTYLVKPVDDIQISGIKMRAHDKLGNFQLSINNKELEIHSKEDGYTLLKLSDDSARITDRNISIEYRFEFLEDDPNRWNFYQLTPAIVGEVGEGVPFEHDFFLSQHAHFNKKDIKEIIKASKGE
ncbi:hypothetical protein AB685_03655 [Bacillus sp. LL01]|uniref:hypothetical protein n=1 Tax=Bacillus sp. LL01 TaxID=1665556 RepID=UPI00064CE502|nr:hypothetical protein [Bacillus sp. LL01]KMJ59955.1 hypothetical protein AB685_03655 [Bacillus sp. LL01]